MDDARAAARVASTDDFGHNRRMTLSAARIMEVGMGFWPAKVLLSAVEIGTLSDASRREGSPPRDCRAASRRSG